MSDVALREHTSEVTRMITAPELSLELLRKQLVGPPRTPPAKVLRRLNNQLGQSTPNLLGVWVMSTIEPPSIDKCPKAQAAQAGLESNDGGASARTDLRGNALGKACEQGKQDVSALALARELGVSLGPGEQLSMTAKLM